MRFEQVVVPQLDIGTTASLVVNDEIDPSLDARESELREFMDVGE
jgi:hypothetical protein